MAKLIQNRRVATDNWLLLKAGSPPSVQGAGEDKSLPAVPVAGDVIVPLALWLKERAALLARIQGGHGRVGVWIEAGEAWDALLPDLPQLPVIALNFPKFGDGRNLSTARLLRERYGYKGELRAIGEVGYDLLLGMYRCGIDAYLLHDGEDADSALQAFGELADKYQASVEEPQPLFRRRAA